MADSFIGGLGFPRGDWESYIYLLLMLSLLVVIGLLNREKKKQEASSE